MSLIKEYIFLIFESKQNLVNIGFPLLFASLLMEKYGNIGTLIGKWYKDYHLLSNKEDKEWFKHLILQKSWRSDENRMIILHDLYNTKNEEEYIQVAQENDMSGDALEEYDFNELKRRLKNAIKEMFFDDTFFRYHRLMADITSGKLKDISPYKNLSYQEALEKYEKKKVFDDIEPIRIYSNGWKWINAGNRCRLIGDLMKNCGSTGVMSMDKDSTMIVLFDPNNTPHVITTYSPNLHRLSGDQGQGNTSVKPEYHQYVIDLADILGAKFDIYTSSSDQLKLKYAFKQILKNIEKIGKDSEWGSSSYYKLTMNDGSTWISNGWQNFISIEDLKKVNKKIKTSLDELLKKVFNHRNKEEIKEQFGVKFYSFQEMKKMLLDENPEDYFVER